MYTKHLHTHTHIHIFIYVPGRKLRLEPQHLVPRGHHVVELVTGGGPGQVDAVGAHVGELGGEQHRGGVAVSIRSGGEAYEVWYVELVD